MFRTQRRSEAEHLDNSAWLSNLLRANTVLFTKAHDIKIDCFVLSRRLTFWPQHVEWFVMTEGFVSRNHFVVLWFWSGFLSKIKYKEHLMEYSARSVIAIFLCETYARMTQGKSASRPLKTVEASSFFIAYDGKASCSSSSRTDALLCILQQEQQLSLVKPITRKYNKRQQQSM